MEGLFQIAKADPTDAPQVAAIHLAARRDAMPYLPELHSDEEVIEWFTCRVAEAPDAFWVARDGQKVVGYFALYDHDLDDLYVRPGHQGRGVGSALLDKAKVLSPQRLTLSTFVQNIRAQTFYVTHGFREIGRTNGRNEERLPDIQYEWLGND